jgi:cell division septation protein DedD
MSDEGFHEIQLNGKQLVFLFMAATVVSVVIFLCGVMVGRGVRVQQGGLLAASAFDVVTDPTAPVESPAPAAPSTTGGAPITSQETLTYTQRLEEADPPVETLTEAPPPAAAPVAEREPEPAVDEPLPTAAPTSGGAPAVPGEPGGSGFVVQVAAVREREEADVIARRLSSKGYPAFVTTPAGVAKVFRVRVGKYSDRREAEAIASKLEREEQFKPWITR